MFKTITDEEFIKKIDSIYIKDPCFERIYRVSRNYLFRAIIFATLLISLSYLVLYDLVLININMQTVLTLLIEISIFIYLFYYLYSIFMFKIVVNSEKIIQNKNIIYIKDIRKLNIKLVRISKNKNERCLVIITNDKKEYIFRLNINNSLVFMKQISILSSKSIEII